MAALENAKKFLHACEVETLGWEGCKDYVAHNATFHSAAASYQNLHTVKDYCEQISHAFKNIFKGSCALHASAYDPETGTAFLYGTSHAEHTGEGGPIAATHKKASIPFVFAMTMDAEGKLQHLEKIYDEASGRSQLGWP